MSFSLSYILGRLTNKMGASLPQLGLPGSMVLYLALLSCSNNTNEYQANTIGKLGPLHFNYNKFIPYTGPRHTKPFTMFTRRLEGSVRGWPVFYHTTLAPVFCSSKQRHKGAGASQRKPRHSVAGSGTIMLYSRVPLTRGAEGNPEEDRF